MKKILLPLMLLLLPVSTFALNLTYPQFPGAPNINDPAQQNLAGIVAWLYVFLVGISGLAAFVMIVWGGMKWMTSSGDTTATSDAKDKIKMALLGLLLVLASFLILQIINPELTLLKGLSLPNILPLPAPTPQLILKANGQEGSVRIPPGEVALEWTIEDVSCQASSDPPDLWAGQKSSSGSERLTLDNEGLYIFAIDCFSLKTSLSRQVRVIVSSRAVNDDAVPGVNLKVRATIEDITKEYDEELTYSENTRRSGLMTFMWNATNTNECFGEDDFRIPQSKKNDLSGSQNIVMPSSIGTYAYRITCINSNNGQSASDTVVITVTQ